MAVTLSSPRPLLPAAERLDSIERAAARAFGHTGFAATSMADVAREAGVTKVLVYRHVDSKEGLYRSILEAVSTTLRVQFKAALATGIADPATMAHLATARIDPDGYRLLFVHAEREPEFAAYAAEITAIIVEVADLAFGRSVPAHLRAWATTLTVRWLVQSILTWLEHGDPRHDIEFVAHTTAGLVSLVDHLIAAPEAPHDDH